MNETQVVRPWVPMHTAAQSESALLAVQVPLEMETIETQRQYQQLLILRVAWLINCWLEESPASVKQTQELLEDLQLKLNPYLFSRPTLPPEESAEQLQSWQMEWAHLLVVDTGEIEHLLAKTKTVFPQPVALPASEQMHIQYLFQRPVSEHYGLEQWLSDLLHNQNK